MFAQLNLIYKLAVELTFQIFLTFWNDNQCFNFVIVSFYESFKDKQIQLQDLNIEKSYYSKFKA